MKTVRWYDFLGVKIKVEIFDVKIKRHNVRPLQKDEDGYLVRTDKLYWKPWKPIDKNYTYWGYWVMVIED